MSLVSNEYLDRIHTDALRVLEETGVKCSSPKVRQILEDTGLAAFDETTGQLYVLSALVEQALALAPGKDAYWIGENAFGVGGTAPFVYDDATRELIPPTLAHIAKIAAIVDRSDPVAFMARGVLIPKTEVKVMDTIMEYCQKPVYTAAVTETGIERAKQIHETRGGLTLQFSIINSPLNIIDGMIPPFLSCVEKGIPVYVSSMPMAGISGPYSMSAIVTLAHAEALFGITLAQVVNPGITVVHAGLPSIASIKDNYAVNLGLVSSNIANLILAKVNERLDLPSLHSACGTSQEHPNEIARQEAVQGYALMKKYGFHHMRHCFGFLKELVSFSMAKLVHHIELCRETGPDQAPKITIDPYDEKGLEAIMRNAGNANYMRDEHTLVNTGKAFGQ